jgi:cytochrome c oxidase subunit II
MNYLPEQASLIAPKIDWLNDVITGLSVFFTVAIVGAMIYFAARYRRRPGEEVETPRIEGSHFLEMVWTVVPTLISFYIMYWGIVLYRELREVPSNAMTINVVGQKWFWEFEYPNGKKTTNEFVVPVNKPVKMLMQSKDVLHSFFIPAMRVKSDVVPGLYTYVTFTPVKTGTYQGFCTEYCGDMHWNMLHKVTVVSQAEYDRWVNDKSDEAMAQRLSPAERGAKLYVSKGCITCHSLDGSPKVGPSYLKAFGRTAEFADGTTAVADENYIKESILNPAKKVVKGFAAGAMPAFEGQLKDDELDSLVAFVKSIDGSAPVVVEEESDEEAAGEVDLASMTPEQKGEYLFKAKACNGCHSLDGSRLVGPSFKGIYGRKGKLADGSEYVADDAYITNSIRNPMSQIVESYPAGMIAFSEEQLSSEDISGIIAYMKTLK